MEAFNLKGFGRNVIDRHLEKLFNYDAAGVRQNFILVYAESGDFLAQWKKYLAHIPEISFEHRLTHLETNLDTKSPADIKIARATHNRHESQTDVYHVFVNVRKG